MIHCHTKKFIRKKNVLFCKKKSISKHSWTLEAEQIISVLFFYIKPVHTSSEQNIFEVYPLPPS